MASENSNLIPKHLSQSNDVQPQQKPSLVVTESVYGLAILRTLIGGACMFAPQFTANLFRIPVTPQQNILGRLIGIREIALGEYLWFCRGGLTDPAQKKELRHILIANVVVDTVDIASCAYGFARGTMSKPAAGIFGGGAILFAVMGLVGLNALKEEK